MEVNVRTNYKWFHFAEMDLFAAGMLLKENVRRNGWQEKGLYCEQAQERAAASFAWMMRTLEESLEGCSAAKIEKVRRLTQNVLCESIARSLYASELTQEERARIFNTYLEITGVTSEATGEEIFLNGQFREFREKMYLNNDFVGLCKLLAEAQKGDDRAGCFSILVYHLLNVEEGLLGLNPWMTFRRRPAQIAFEACKEAMDMIRSRIPLAEEKYLDAEEYREKKASRMRSLRGRIVGRALTTGGLALFTGMIGSLVFAHEFPRGLLMAFAIAMSRMMWFSKEDRKGLKGDVKKIRELKRDYVLSEALRPERRLR
ncbi:MAG: hypothetical protein IJM26_08775 [Lachnospiraceae bacterium]|nr:hypothetical protein [Lachnospiraceae bacterium]